MSMEDTVAAAETTVFQAAQGVLCLSPAAAPVALTTVQVQGLRAVLLAVFRRALNSFLVASTHGLRDSVDHT